MTGSIRRRTTAAKEAIMVKCGKIVKQAYRISLCTIILSSLCMAICAADDMEIREPPALRVAFFPLAGFFEYDQNGNEVGYGVDLLNMISKYTGYRFEYIPAESWEATKYMLIDGVADVRMPGTVPKTASTTLRYTEQSVIDSYHALMTLKTRDDLYYKDHETFGTLKIGISQGLYDSEDFKREFAAANILDQNIVFYDEYNACRDALATGEVDAIVSNIMDLDGEMKQLDRFTTVSNYISMLIGDLRINEINDALSQIKLNEPTTLSGLYKKWFPERVALPFTKEETAYKEALESLTFSFRDGQGYLSRRNSYGEFVGFYPEVAKMFCEKLGVDCVQTILMDDDVEGPVIYPDFYYDHYWANENRTDITQPYVRVNYYAITDKRNQIDANTCKVAAVPLAV